MPKPKVPESRGEAEKLLQDPQKSNVYLTMFWSAAENAKPGKRLELLRAMNDIKPERPWTKPDKRRAAMRKHFTFEEYNFPDEEPCFLCGGQWRHRHHILNLRNGGANSRKNLVPLCKRCHQVVHQRSF